MFAFSGTKCEFGEINTLYLNVSRRKVDYTTIVCHKYLLREPDREMIKFR